MEFIDQKLIPQYNNNNNLFDQIEILHNLFLLSYVYLQFNLEGFNINEFESLEDTDGEQIYINNEVILNYLNDISFIIISNLKRCFKFSGVVWCLQFK